MYILSAHVERPISFLITDKEPTKLELRPGLWLINPLVPIGEGHAEDRITRVRAGYFVRATTLRFVVTDEKYLSSDESNFALDELPARLRAARLESCDPFQPIQVRGESLEHVALTRLPARRLDGELVSNALLAPAPTRQRIAHRLREFASALGAKPPESAVYCELVLDAIAAEVEDPRRAILFAALAIEQMASAQLDLAYQRARAERRAGWRWVESGGDSLPVDPVFEKLRHSSRANFRALLVEVPLYAIGRSLLHENKRIFDLAVRLRKVRNYLSHGGELPQGEDVFTIDHTGAHMALRLGEWLFSWFGERNYFWALPRSDEIVDVDAAMAELTVPGNPDPNGPVSWRYVVKG